MPAKNNRNCHCLLVNTFSVLWNRKEQLKNVPMFFFVFCPYNESICTKKNKNITEILLNWDTKSTV